MAKIEAEKELTLREMELKAQDQASASLAATPPPRNKDAKSPKLPSFIDEKDELDSYLLRFERYAENASWEKDTWAIKPSALLTGRAMDVYTRMSDADASDYNKLKKALLTRYNYTEDGYRKRFREATPETEETPDQFVIRLKELFGRLRKARITARPTKCLLGASRMEFLGHQVGGDVITPSRDNLEKVRNTPRPTTKKQVRSFLGLIGYYRDHIPAFAEISAPLTDLLKKGKAEHIQWSEAQERAYSLLKEYLLH